MVHQNIKFSVVLYVTQLVLHNCVLCNTFSSYVIIEGAFNKKMRFIFKTFSGNGNKLFVLLGF